VYRKSLFFVFLLEIYITFLTNDISAFSDGKMPHDSQAVDNTLLKGLSLSLSLRIIGEYEKTYLSNSLINPDNLLKRPTDRAETIFLFGGAYDLWGGEIEGEFRANLKYLKGSSSSSFHDREIRGGFNELFYQRDIGNFSITLGQKRIRWGVGYSLSPTDIITRLRDPEDPEDRLQSRRGSELFLLSYATGESQLDVIYFPEVVLNIEEARFIQNRMGFRYYRYMEPVDISFVGKIEEGSNWAAGINSSVTLGKALELHGEYLFTSFNNTLYPEGNPNRFFLPFSKKDNNVHELLLGGHYTFENYWNITMEYIYRSQGYSDTEWDDYTNHIRFLNQNLEKDPQQSILSLLNAASVFELPLRKHYLFLRLFRQEIFQSFSLQWYSFIGLTDGSGFSVLEPKYTASDWYNIYLRLEKFWGNPVSEFGLAPEDLNAIAGITLFF